MRVLRCPLLALAAAVLAACGDNTPPPSSELTDAEEAFIALALPALQTQCMACHTQPEHELPFLAGDTPLEVRESLLASGVVNVEDPAQSAIFTKGVHTGPAWRAAQVADLLAWLAVERDAN